MEIKVKVSYSKSKLNNWEQNKILIKRKPLKTKIIKYSKVQLKIKVSTKINPNKLK